MAKKKPAEVPPLRLEWRSPAELAENPRNWRRHPDAQTAALADVITEVGWAGARLYNEGTGRLIDGHARRKVALEQGCERVPVLVGSWSEADEAKILATLDPIGALATRDEEALAALLLEVTTESEAVLALLASLAPVPDVSDPGGGGDDFDATPEEQGPTRTNAGEVWVIGGKHRLLVGDCTVRENVERLMGGARAVLVVTDPPYLVDYDGGRHPQSWSNKPEVKDKHWDSYNEQPAATQFYHAFISATMASAVTERAGWYQWYASLRAPEVHDAWRANGLLTHAVLVWVKSRPVLTHTRYMWQHELCVYGWKEGFQPNVKPPANATTVWEFDQKQANADHPTEKPLALIARAIQHQSCHGDLVYDPFLGSGTTLIAAHRLGRTCYGCEIEPRYCDVILKRAEAEGLACALVQ